MGRPAAQDRNHHAEQEGGLVRYYLCDLCKYDTGPFKPVEQSCVTCQCGCNFRLRDKLCPKEKQMLDKHDRLDEFINSLGIELLPWQRLMVHRCVDEKRPLYIRMHKDDGLEYARKLAAECIQLITNPKD